MERTSRSETSRLSCATLTSVNTSKQQTWKVTMSPENVNCYCTKMNYCDFNQRPFFFLMIRRPPRSTLPSGALNSKLVSDVERNNTTNANQLRKKKQKEVWTELSEPEYKKEPRPRWRRF